MLICGKFTFYISQTILIFGAGLNQYLLIKAAKDLGVTSVVLDPNPDAPGRKIADYFYIVPVNDYKTTKQIALKHKVDGLATTQMEKPLIDLRIGFCFYIT